jgi:hypothetical protein
MEERKEMITTNTKKIYLKNNDGSMTDAMPLIREAVNARVKQIGYDDYVFIGGVALNIHLAARGLLTTPMADIDVSHYDSTYPELPEGFETKAPKRLNPADYGLARILVDNSVLEINVASLPFLRKLYRAHYAWAKVNEMDDAMIKYQNRLQAIKAILTNAGKGIRGDK